jgi:uncharacterized repeat protein (TIGR02543 family)
LATIYGSTINHWRCYINTWSSEDGSSVSAGLTVGIQDCGWGFQIWNGIVGHASANGSDSEVNTSFNTPTGSWNTKDITSASQRFVKGHTAYNVTLSGWVRNQSGYMNGTSSASQTIAIPALAHHYVTFDANGGTGAPGRVDKWYGESLTIPSQKPTRTNYEFLGWSTTSTGTAAYQSGQTYGGTPDADYTLYAVWKLLYIPPKFTDGLAIRTNSMTSTTADHSGGYCYASFTYKVDTTVYPSNVAKSIVCRYYQDGSSTGVTLTPTGDLNKASGTINVHFKASINSVYYVECTLTDTKSGTATISRSTTTGVLPMEVANQGKSVGILSAAPKSAGLKLGGSGNPDFLIAADTKNNKLDSMVQIHGSTSANGQGGLTLSTQGLDSKGNVARGTFNLIADSLKLNGVETRLLKQTNKQANQVQWLYSDGLMITFLDYALSSRDGYNSAVRCSYKKFVYMTPYKGIFNVQTSMVNIAPVGFYGNIPVDCAESYLDSVMVRAFVDLAVNNAFVQAIVFGTWK